MSAQILYAYMQVEAHEITSTHSLQRQWKENQCATPRAAIIQIRCCLRQIHYPQRILLAIECLLSRTFVHLERDLVHRAKELTWWMGRETILEMRLGRMGC